MTKDVADADVVLSSEGFCLAQWRAHLAVAETSRFDAGLRGRGKDGLEICISQHGSVLLRYAPNNVAPAAEPELATEPPPPAEVSNSDELFLIGTHLEQYRHPTRAPEAYWLEAVRRDAGDSRSNHALGRFHLRRGELGLAEQYVLRAIARLTSRNPNPGDGEPHYTLGRIQQFSGDLQKAYDAYYKCTSVAGWRGPGYLRLAEIDCVREHWLKALDHLERSLLADADNLFSLNLKVIVLRRLNRQQDANFVLRRVRELDRLDTFSRFLESGQVAGDVQQQLDLAFDLQRAGLLQEAHTVLLAELPDCCSGGNTMRLYVLGALLARMGKETAAASTWWQAAASNPDYVFPHRLDEMLVLEGALLANGQDGKAHFYLGNFLYDRRRYPEAIEQWQLAVALDEDNAVAWRNLGLAFVNLLHDKGAAQTAFARARRCAPNDARLLFEQDQLFKLLNVSPQERLRCLTEHLSLVHRRDDLTLEFVTLMNSTGQASRALAMLQSRHFGPWEGGEGQVLAQFVRSLVLLACNALREGKPTEALDLLESALNPPRNLSEAHHLLVNLSLVEYWMGVAEAAQERRGRAVIHWERAARQVEDFQRMQVQPVSELTFWSASALRRLEPHLEASQLFAAIGAYAEELEQTSPKIDYFATSLPALLLFHEDMQASAKLRAAFLHAQARLGVSDPATAERMLREVLAADPSHTGALDMLRLMPDLEL